MADLLAPVALAAALLAPPTEPVELRLELGRDPSGAPTLAVRMRVPGDDDGETVLALDQGWGGTDAAACDLELVAVRDVEGEPLAWSGDGPGRWSVRHAPGARFEFEARLAATSHQDDDDPRVHYRPILNERVLHLIGNLALPLPEDLDGDLPRPVRVEWSGADELGWETACSLGRGAGPFEVVRPLFQLRTCLFLAGEFELFEHEVPGGTLLVAAAGEQWGFDREEFARMARDVVALEREFFDDRTRAFHLVSLLPVGRADPARRSLGGTALHQAFAVFSLPGVELLPAGQGGSFTDLLLHEMFHDWNGHLLRRVAPSERLFWFSEGFTCFYTRRLALRGGWLDAAGYAADLDRVLGEYANNPAREADAARVEAEFWSDPNVQKQPYQLGDLIAARVDAAIRERSGGERSLDDFLRELVAEAHAHTAGVLEIETEDLLARLERWTDAGTVADVRASAVDGAPFELPPDTFAPVLEIGYEPLSGGRERQRARLVAGTEDQAAARL